MLLHVVAKDPDPARDVVADYDVLERELASFDPELVKRPRVVALGKIDLLSREELRELVGRFAERGIKVLPMSAATHAGTNDVLVALERYVRKTHTQLEAWEDGYEQEDADEDGARDDEE